MAGETNGSANRDEETGDDAPFEKIAVANLTDPALGTLHSIAALHARSERTISRPQRVVETGIERIGRPRFLLLALVIVGGWIGVNLLAPRFGRAPFDAPPFGILQVFLAVSSLLLMVMILIAENRQSVTAERRAQLDLQISLLADQKSAKIISLLEELRRDMPEVKDRRDREAEAMQEATDPEAMLVAIDFMLNEAAADTADSESLREEIDAIGDRIEAFEAGRHDPKSAAKD
jgi:uncharacterized membrane protein